MIYTCYWLPERDWYFYYALYFHGLWAVVPVTYWGA